jgi:hypothetical protein
VRETTAAQNPNPKSIEIQIKNASKSKLDKKKRNSKQEIAKTMKAKKQSSSFA